MKWLEWLRKWTEPEHLTLTPEEQVWWDQIEPHFRTRMLVWAGLKAALVVLLYYLLRMKGVDWFAFWFLAVMYTLFGWIGLKSELPTRRDRVIEARRFEQKVLAEPDAIPVELAARATAPRRFK